jgi:O-antigen ligase
LKTWLWEVFNSHPARLGLLLGTVVMLVVSILACICILLLVDCKRALEARGAVRYISSSVGDPNCYQRFEHWMRALLTVNRALLTVFDEND